MTTLKRIQLSRKKGYRLPVGAINVARPGRWGNPFKVGPDRNHRQAVRDFDHWLFNTPEGREKAVSAIDNLRGHDLACWCKPGEKCHADVYLNLVNRPEAEPVKMIRRDEFYAWNGKKSLCVGFVNLSQTYAELHYCDGTGGGAYMGEYMGKVYPVALLDVLDGKDSAQ